MTTFTITSFDAPCEPTNFFGIIWQNICLSLSKKAKAKKAASKLIHELGVIIHTGWNNPKDANRKIDAAIKLGADKVSIANLLITRDLTTMPFGMMCKILELDPRNKEKNASSFANQCFKAGQRHIKLLGPHQERACWARDSFEQAKKMFEEAGWSPKNFWAEYKDAMEKTDCLVNLKK